MPVQAEDMLKNGSGGAILPWAEPCPASRWDFRGKQIRFSEDISAVVWYPAHSSGSRSGGLQGAQCFSRQDFSTCVLLAVGSGPALCFSYRWLLCCGNQMCLTVLIKTVHLWFSCLDFSACSYIKIKENNKVLCFIFVFLSASITR